MADDKILDDWYDSVSPETKKLIEQAGYKARKGGSPVKPKVTPTPPMKPKDTPAPPAVSVKPAGAAKKLENEITTLEAERENGTLTPAQEAHLVKLKDAYFVETGKKYDTPGDPAIPPPAEGPVTVRPSTPRAIKSEVIGKIMEEWLRSEE